MTDAPKQSPLASPEPWSLVADDYTLELLPMFELFSRDALALAPTPKGARVLDVAAGPGTLRLLAARSGGSLSSIDFSPQMVANLKRRGPLGDPEEVARKFASAGFVDVQVTAQAHTLPAGAPREVWAQCQRTTAPIVLLKRRLGEAKWDEVTSGIVARLEAEFGTGPVDISTTAYLGRGRKSP